MRFSVKRRWQVLLAVVLLVVVFLASRGNKKVNIETAQEPASSPQVTKQPTTASAASSAPQQLGTLALLPEAPTSNDFLLAVFRGESGRVKYRWEKNGQTLDGEELDRLAIKHLSKGAVITVHVDNAGKSYSASVTIGNLPPVVRQVSFKQPAIYRGVDIELLASGEDVDGDAVTFNYKWFRNGSQIDAINGPKLSGDQFSRGDRISFQVIPFDGVEMGTPYEGMAMTIPNAPPLFISTPPLQFLSEAYSYQAQAKDPDGDEVTYVLENPPPGMMIDNKTGEINWPLTALPAGVYRISIVADDGQGQKNYQEYSLTMSRQ